MGSPLMHARSSARKYGGEFEDYIHIHKWFDSTKGHFPNFKHRAILHNSFGMLLAEQVFGDYVTNSDGKMIEVRQIAYVINVEWLCALQSVAHTWFCCGR